MTCIEVVPATREHVRIVVRDMRPIDRAEIERRGYHVRHLTHYLYRHSTTRKTVLVDGAVAAVAGLYGPLLDDESQPWLFTTPEIERAKVTFFREVRREIHDALLCHRRLSTYVLASYTQSIRFYTALGFKIGPPEPIGIDGVPYCLMSIERA